MRAQAQANVQPDIADDYEPWLIEAFLRKEWGGPSERLGRAGWPDRQPVFARAHRACVVAASIRSLRRRSTTGCGKKSASPASRASGGTQAERGPRLGIVVGAGYGPDRLGRLLALRGWVMGDGLSGFNSDLPLPNGTRTEIFDERDDRPAAYTGHAQRSGERAALKAGYFDNAATRMPRASWHTHFTTVGAILHPLPQLDIVVQYLRGKALVRDTRTTARCAPSMRCSRIAIEAHRATVRYDEFRVRRSRRRQFDRGEGRRHHGRRMHSSGDCVIGLALEYTWLDSRRPGSATPDARHDGWQLSYRFRY